MGTIDSNCPGVSGALYWSRDGGASWQQRCNQAFFYNGTEYFPGGESSVGHDNQGMAYALGSYGNLDDDNPEGFLAVQKSSDGGNTWTLPVPALGHRSANTPSAQIAIDTSTRSPHVNAVYVAAVLASPRNNPRNNLVMVSHSYDGGTTWTQVPVTPLEKYPEEDAYINLAVSPDGSVYVTWVYCDTPAHFCADNKAHIVLSKSTDGGNTWTKAKQVVTTTIGTLQDYLFLPPTPLITVDNSTGPYSGTVYIAMCSDARGTLRLGMIHSRDGGETWSKPVSVAPAVDTHDQFLPWLSVSPTGLVGMSWMDRRNDPNNLLYQPFAAFSSDGGQSFGENILLSEGFSDPSRGGEGSGWIGDYTGNTWAGPNYFVAAWMDNSQTPNMEDVVGGIRLK
ncbi:MAG: sialidase family protein [Terriglobales bacterium]